MRFGVGWILRAAGSLFFLALLGADARAFQEAPGEEAYARPPESVVELFGRDKSYAVLNHPSPDGEYFLIPHFDELSTVQRMSRKTLRLAMLEIRPSVNREWRVDTFGIDGLEIYSLRNRTRRKVDLPTGVLISDLTWSPDSRKVAFLAHLEHASQVWVADAALGKAGPLSEAPVLATLAATRPASAAGASPQVSKLIQWTPEGEVLTILVPADRGPEPEAPATASGPLVRHTREKPTPTRTLPFLLRTQHDEELFRHYTTGQLAILAAGREPKAIGPPAMYLSVALSPDGAHILTERITEPLSRLAGYDDFPKRLEVLDRGGQIVSTIREIPLDESLPRGPDRVEADLPREVAWRPDGKGLGFLWREPKKKEGEPNGAAESDSNGKRMDRVMSLEAPFDVDRAKIWVSSEKRFKDLAWSVDGRHAVATVAGKRDSDGKNVEQIVAWTLDGKATQTVLTNEYDPKDVLKLPGEIFTVADGNGVRRVLVSGDGSSVYLAGEGFQEDFKPRPFVDRVAWSGGPKQRLFESSGEAYEKPLIALDADLGRMIVSRESIADFPDSFLWSRDDPPANLTRNRDPFPETTACKRIDFEFTRRDGAVVQGRISMPVGYREGTRVPAMFWTYPREYEDAKEYRNAALRSRNRNEFPQLSYLRWSDIWLTQGYALVYPDVPILGKGDRFNDQYISQLSDTLYAAIRKLDGMGLIDPDRLGHGGHSYGAFASANLLAHTPYFKAGIAGHGAYNRTLTPMTFQSEKRFVWEAPHAYLEMSPFFYADQINTPLLMYHGMDDDNSGTFVIQSERMMQALTGLGKTAVLYLYPYESHSPRSRETLLDLWARWLEWFDRYVKGGG